jgi:paraquat-inducible protein A
MRAPPLIACHECDLLQREAPLPHGGIACCRRCGAVLYRSARDSLDRTLACALGASILFVLTNGFPIVALEVQGNRNAATLFDAVRRLYDQDMPIIAALVLLTTMILPALELAATLYMLLPLRLGRVPAGLGPLFRVVQSVRPWSMVEVFMLGVLVSLVKLRHLATVVPGIALWSFAGLMLLMAATAASFKPRDLWAHVELAR